MRAWELHEQGWKQKDIAAALGVSEGAVSQWFKKAKAQGVQALRHQPPPGATAETESRAAGAIARDCWPKEPKPSAFVETSGPPRGWPR